MKTSNKILLIFLLSLLGTVGAVHLALYAKYRQGRIVTKEERNGDWVTQYKGKTPVLVSLQGNINITIEPSDTFFVAIERGGDEHVSLVSTGDDALVIKGEDSSTIDPHNMFQNYSGRPWVVVHTGTHSHIQLTGVLALLKGRKTAGAFDADIRAINSQLWIGESYGFNNAPFPTESYDSLQVHAENANIILHGNAFIRQLSLQLDKRSEINDRHAGIGGLDIRYTDSSKINLTGANLNKLHRRAD